MKRTNNSQTSRETTQNNEASLTTVNNPITQEPGTLPSEYWLG